MVAAIPGASCRSAFISRSTPLVRVATPIRTGHTSPSRSSLARSSNTRSRGGGNIRQQLLHQLVVVVGERLQHGEAGVFLAIEIIAFEIDDLGRGVLLVDKGPFEREVDEAGHDFVFPGRESGAAATEHGRPPAAA